MHKLLNKIRKMTPRHLLALLFVVYLGFMASGCLPKVLYDFGRCLYWKTGFQEFFTAIDSYDKDMLSIEQDQSLHINKGSYINLNGMMARLLRQPVMNNRILLKNGHLSTLPTDTIASPDQIRESTENIIRFHDIHTANGGNFLYVMVPNQLSKYEDMLPAGYINKGNDSADIFLSYLQEAGVPCLDLREELQKDGISITDAFYNTDHHWTPQTGFWAYGKIMDKLAQMGAIEPVDPFYTDLENYHIATYEDTFLGSSGKRTGRYFAGLDDSYFIYPKFETNISVKIPSREVDIRGRFEEVSFHQQLPYDLNNPDFFNKGTYSFYGWNDTPITHWRNEQAQDQSKFLLIGESFGNVPFSFMSICLGVCDELDVRYFEEDFSEYYYNYMPDTVVLEFNSGAIISEFTDYKYLSK